MSLQQIAKDTCIVRNTAGHKGRTVAVEPGAASRYLYYGRIVLDEGDAPIRFDTGERETGLVCLKGSATVRANGQAFTLGRLDSLYVPRDGSIEVTAAAGGCDLAEIAAPVERQYPLQFVRLADVQKNPELRFNAGKDTNQREVNILIGKNVDAGRIMAGDHVQRPGQLDLVAAARARGHARGGVSLHRYAGAGFGLQLVYTDATEPEIATIVREGDVVLMPQGYHPNVAAPGGSINFLWMMAANREREDRKYGVFNVQPEFAPK